MSCVVLVRFAASLAISGVLLHAQVPNLFVYPGAQAGDAIEGFIANPAVSSSPVATFRSLTTAAGTFAVLPNLDSSKFFIVSSATTNSVLAADAALLSTTLVANLPVAPSQAIITPDGTYLAVAAGTVHIFNTANNSELVSGGISQGSGITTFSIATGLDSAAVFALGSHSSGGSQLDAISTTTYTVTATLPLPTAKATGLSVGPNGLLYVSLPNQILEVDPRTLKVTLNGTMPVSGTPGPLVFTPDGQYGVAVNETLTGNSLIIATLPNHTVSAPSLGLLEPTALEVTGTNTLLAATSQGLFQVALNPLSVTQISVSTGTVVALAPTNDVPTSAHTTVQAVYLATAVSSGPFAPATYSLSALNPASRALSTPYPVASNVIASYMSYAPPALRLAQSHLGSLLVYGNNQTVPVSTISHPLVVRVLDTNNLPLSGVTVQFQASGSGAALTSASAITGSNGYALTYLSAPATTGTVTVTATAGSLTAPFSLTATSGSQSGTTLTILAGQGQIMAAQTSTLGGLSYGSPLQVAATDANGNPIPNLAVTYTVPAAQGTLEANNTGGSSLTVNTNSSGVASMDFLTTAVPFNSTAYLQSTITASAANATPVTFYITTVNQGQVNRNFLAPLPGTTVTGPEGSVLPGAVKGKVFSSTGYGIPNVALGVNVTKNPNPGITVSCNSPGGLVLTDSNGLASCDLLLGPKLGSGSFTASIGYTAISYAYPFVITAGAPAVVQIIQGNNQSGAPGQKLLPLIVHVTDSGGNIIQGASVNWQVVTAGAVTLSSIVATTDYNGNASAVATLGSIGGTAQVSATVGSLAPATFNLTVNIPVANIEKVSGDQQTATINTAFASPLVVQVVDSNGNGIPATQVSFQVASGTATLGSATATTDSMGQASTTVTAGATAGTITVTATVSTFSAAFSLTAELPAPTDITVLNGASFDPNSGISPGSIAVINGAGILPGVTGTVKATPTNGKYPTTFSGVTITFEGTAAPIYSVQVTSTGDQVSVQVPFEVQPGSAVSLQVSVANHGSTTITVPVKGLSPGMFTSTYSGKPYAVAVRPDGTQVSPTNPAHRGENLQLYVTGLGQATPPIATNTPGVANQTVTSSVLVGLNNAGVPLVSAVYAPNLTSEYIVTFQVPSDIQVGTYQPIGLIAIDSAGNFYYAQPAFIPIQ